MRVLISVLIVAASLSAAAPALAQQQNDVVIKMSECDKKRRLSLYLEAGILVKTSRQIVRKGTISVKGEDFDIYLPRDESPYSTAPRPKRKTDLLKFTSTYLAVDQNHDGKLASWESYLAEFPLRIGDSMFDVIGIDPDGSSITLRPTDKPLQGAVVGRKAPEFEFKTIDGKTVNRDTYKGRALVIDCWAPS